jgi:hypothetical protein
MDVISVGGAIGMLPSILMEVYFGTFVKNVTDLVSGHVEETPLSRLFFYGGLLATICATFFVSVWVKKKLELELDNGGEENSVELAESAFLSSSSTLSDSGGGSLSSGTSPNTAALTVRATTLTQNKLFADAVIVLNAGGITATHMRSTGNGEPDSEAEDGPRTEDV